jgi:gas vesicle protein
MPRPDRIMEHDNNHNHNGSGNGFLLGVIVGVLITLLFTTKRGRAILKDAMEKGVQKFADLEEMMRESEAELEDEFDEEDGDDYIPTEPVEEPEPPKVQKSVEKKTSEETAKIEQKTLQPAKPDEEKPKFLDDAAVDESVEEKPVMEQKEEKPKSTRVKRLFRGLRKKS